MRIERLLHGGKASGTVASTAATPERGGENDE